MKDTSVIDRQVVLPPSNDPERGSEHWSAIFVLSEDLPAPSRDVVLKALREMRLSAALVEQHGILSLSLGVVGPMDDALSHAVGAVRDALSALDHDIEVVEVRMVGHRDAELQLERKEPVAFYGVTECAKALGITRQRVRQLLSENKLPRPDAVVGGKVIWDASAFDRFAEHRRDVLERTPLGQDPGLTTKDPEDHGP